jgi:hypothetical protein
VIVAVCPDQVGAFARLSEGFISGCDPLPNQYSGRYIRLVKYAALTMLM